VAADVLRKGAKGHRHYDWAFLRLDHGEAAPDGQAGKHWLMVRRNHKTGELVFYRCYSRDSARPVATLGITLRRR
jgi:hypothetical protein